MAKKTAFEIVNENRKKLVELVIQNLEKGYLWEAGWDINALRPQNGTNDTKYNGINRLHLGYCAVEKSYKDPRWVTFIQAKENGWKVKPGEKGVQCEFWKWTKLEKIKDENGNEKEVESLLNRPLVNYFTVFNMEQLERNYPKFQLANIKEDEIFKIADNLIASSPIPVKEIAQDRAYYSPLEEHIVMPLRGSFASSQDYIATLTHELAHSTMKELGRDNGSLIKGNIEYAREELVAELSSMFLQAELGIKVEGKHFENHTAYLESWASLMKKDPNELYTACAKASKACDLLLDRYLEHTQYKNQTINFKEYKELLNLDNREFFIKNFDNDKYFNLQEKFKENISKLNKELEIYTGTITFSLHKDPKQIEEWNLTAITKNEPTYDIRGNYKECIDELLSNCKYIEIFQNLVKNNVLIGINNYNEHGKKEGLWKEYTSENIEISNYQNGIKDGKFLELFSNNEIKSLGSYENGEKSPTSFSFNKDTSELIKNSWDNKDITWNEVSKSDILER